jgi:Domain of unknown function DUF11
MSGIKDQTELDAMRKRLYERAAPPRPADRTPLSNMGDVVPRQWHGVPTVVPEVPTDPRTSNTSPTLEVLHTGQPPRKRTYRMIVVAATLGIFLLVLGVTGMYMFMGNNQVSDKNIDVAISGPLTAGGGEKLSLEMLVTNDNTVPIESAVLIVHFPSGTKSTEEGAKDMLEDRLTIGRIEAGESLKLPVSAIVYGEENQEREITATIEYRLVGSSGTFYKDATPYLFKVISSPVVIRIDSVKKVSSGQEVEMTLTIQSNASTPIKDVLVTADYPNNFDYSNATPVPLYRENAWLISELKSEQAATIKIKGAVLGQQAEEFQVKFQVGTAKPENQFEIGSVLAQATTDFVIEQPFINVGLNVNGLENEVVTLKTGDQTTVTVNVRNTLTDTLYDMSVEVAVKGNVLVRDRVRVSGGYYDSVKDVIRFEPSGNKDLAQVTPGESLQFSFTLEPSDNTATPSFTLTANASAKRVFESDATEQLVGTAKSEVKFTSSVVAASQLGRDNAGFAESGPFPPVADLATTYTVTVVASAGGNDVTGASLATALPQYVNWQNQSSGDGTLVFNPISKEVTWTIGDIEAGKTKQAVFQVSILPSQNQIGSTPAILSTQRFRATDRFTGEVVRAEAPPLSTELSTEAGFEKGNGEIRATVGATTDDN